jgi:hypothetical protein
MNARKKSRKYEMKRIEAITLTRAKAMSQCNKGSSKAAFIALKLQEN